MTLISQRPGTIASRLAMAGGLTVGGIIVATVGVLGRRPLVALAGGAMAAYGVLGIEVYR
jgi:hypothetical protein